MIQLKSFARPLLTAISVITALAVFAPVAAATEPDPKYTQFAGCPSPEENANVEACFRSEVNGGNFQMGNKDVPITEPIVLSGGLTTPATGAQFVFNSKGGLEPAKQLVPGGIIGLTGLDWLVDFLDVEELKLYAVTELAGVPSNPLLDPFNLPIKVHLENPVLGNNCYVGSDSNPIDLELTRGTTNPPPPNEPITGQEPTIKPNLEKGVIELKDSILVDNAFAAPKSNGCELDLGFIKIGIDTLVSEVSELPSPAGTNETVQEADGELVGRSLVYP